MESEPLKRRVNSVFDVYDVQDEEEKIKFYGVPQTDSKSIYRNLVPEFRERGYKIRLTTEKGERVIIAEPIERSFPWTNVLLGVLTLLTTLFAGIFWYPIEPLDNPASILRTWPFAVSVMGVLGAHEFGHYIMSKYHGVEATLPYFIPFPSPIGTMGAVIRVKGVIPDRKALFDIGIAGPL
ncbi:MAG: site-2 protease family protein, partial [Halobacteria archaeon]|nr:site-2 protease family protein [Halobacteria archaeon]